MIVGAINVQRTVSKSQCMTSEDYYLTKVADYKVYPAALLPAVKFEKAKEVPESIDKSIFTNDGDSKLTFNANIKTQNYLTTRFIGRAPYEFYGPKTKLGRTFILTCENGDPSYKTRRFGTEGASGGTNTTANELVTYPNE